MSGIKNTPMLLMATLMVLAPLSGCFSFITGEDSGDDGQTWVDPVVEIEDSTTLTMICWRTGCIPPTPS